MSFVQYIIQSMYVCKNEYFNKSMYTVIVLSSFCSSLAINRIFWVVFFLLSFYTSHSLNSIIIIVCQQFITKYFVIETEDNILVYILYLLYFSDKMMNISAERKTNIYLYVTRKCTYIIIIIMLKQDSG